MKLMNLGSSSRLESSVEVAAEAENATLQTSAKTTNVFRPNIKPLLAPDGVVWRARPH
jgi:hypothetical protein